MNVSTYGGEIYLIRSLSFFDHFLQLSPQNKMLAFSLSRPQKQDLLSQKSASNQRFSIQVYNVYAESLILKLIPYNTEQKI